MIQTDRDLKMSQARLDELKNENRVFMAPNIGCSMSLVTVLFLVVFMFSIGEPAYRTMGWVLLVLFLLGAGLLLINYMKNRTAYQENKKEIQALEEEIELFQNRKT